MRDLEPRHLNLRSVGQVDGYLQLLRILRYRLDAIVDGPWALAIPDLIYPSSPLARHLVRIDDETLFHHTALVVIPPTRAHQATHHQPLFFQNQQDTYILAVSS
jgi:hypothetical protein